MPRASSVSAIRAMPSASAAPFTGMWFTVLTHGTGMFIPTGCMLMLSRLSPIRCGGIGDITPTDGGVILITVMVGDGTIGTVLAGD